MRATRAPTKLHGLTWCDPQLRETKFATFCGVFWRGKEDTEPFFKILRAGEYGFPFQPFWTEEPQYGFNNDEVAAVAAHFNVVQQDASYVAVYTAHLVALGPSVVKRPWMSEQPAWSDKLFPCGISIEKGSCALTHVPQLRGENMKRCSRSACRC